MSCTCVLVRVDQNDLISATGNTNPLYDNKVFFSGITGCNNTSISVEYSGSGYYFHCAHTTGYTCNCSGSGWVKYNETACIKSATTAGYTPDPSDLYEVEDAVSNIQSCLYGTLFFDSGYSLCGSGVAVASVPSGTYWANTTLSTTNGPYNREAIWTDLPADKPYDTWLGLSYCTLTGTTDMKTYYIGIGAVNNFKVVLDGVEILDTTAGPCITGTQSLTTWRVYPISVGVGSHIIEYYGYNYGNPGGVGFVIYDKDLSSLTASTTDVAAGVIYNSNSEIGNNFEFCQDLSGDYLISGYTCPVGYTYSVCLGTCVKFNYCELTPILTDTPSLFYYQDNILLSGTSIDSIYDDRESLCSTSGDCTSSICTSTSGFCLNDTGYDTYDDYYIESGYHNGNPYWSGETDGLLIYYSTGNTQWCLSTVLDGDCLLFGKSPCVSVCPDLCDTYFSNVICPTPTPSPTIPCSALNFDAIFNCNVPSPSVTPTMTPTITPTPTQSGAVLCPNIFVNASINSYSPTPTPTQTVTPTPSGVVNRPFGLSGDVTFNTVDEKIKCPVSLQFQDCITGMIYSTMDDVETPLGGSLSQYMVFEGTVNGDIKCMYYIGQNQNISGIDQIILTNGPLGYSNLDGCNNCFLPTPTPTPTPTITPTMTLTPTNTPTPTITPSQGLCTCPEGYTLIGDLCEQVLFTFATPPENPIIIGNNFEDYPTTFGGDRGLIIYEEVTNKGWPLFGLPNIQGSGIFPNTLPSTNNATPSSLSLIPNTGYTNQGILYTSLSPSSSPGSPHAPLNYPTGYWPETRPLSNNPPNLPNIDLYSAPNNLTYLAESYVSSGVLNLGSGSSVNLEYNRSNGVFWGLSSNSNSWQNQVGIWSDAPSPYDSNPTYSLFNKWVGVTSCVEIPESKLYYILITANNAFRISVNGLLMVEINVGDGNYQPLGFTNCFPITLSSGTNTVTFEGGNYGGGGLLSAEILNVDTVDNILTATTYSHLTPYSIFSTKEKRPRAFDINFTSGSTTITSSGQFLPKDVGAFVQFPSFVLSGTYISNVIDSSTAIITSGATATGLGVAGNVNGTSTGRIYFIYDSGTLFASGLPQGFTCPEGYEYSNCSGPECIQVSKILCP
jgi:hypothetical protein